MDKKQLKEFINKNGGFTHLAVTVAEGLTEKQKADLPEGAKFFSGIASNGDLNRNGYIIVLEAWRKSIAAYMGNPVVLLGHDHDKPIGRCTKMEITTKGLYVEGFVFDEYTDGRLSKGLITSLSTGHYAKAYDFLNLKTGRIISKQDFRRQWGAFWDLDDDNKDHIDNWVRRITETEIVEFSFVSIPANRKSKVAVKEELEKWYKDSSEVPKLAKTAESIDNSNVTTKIMHNLTAEDLEKFPTLAEKFNVGDAINAEAWEAITGEKLDTKGQEAPATDDNTDEKPGETPGGGDASSEGEGVTGSTAENAGDNDSEDEDEETPNAENAEEEPEPAAEKVAISKDARKALAEEAQKAKERAEELKEALDGTISEDEPEAKPDGSDAEKTQESFNEMVEKTFAGMLDALSAQQSQIEKLTEALDNVPAKKGLVIQNQFGGAAKDSKESKKQSKERAQIEELKGMFSEGGVSLP